MSFIQRELDRVTAQMLQHPTGSPEWREHYAAQQALSFALDPAGARSPADMLSGRPVHEDPPVFAPAMPLPIRVSVASSLSNLAPLPGIPPLAPDLGPINADT